MVVSFSPLSEDANDLPATCVASTFVRFEEVIHTSRSFSMSAFLQMILGDALPPNIETLDD